MSQLPTQSLDPRHDPALALAWLDALDPAIRACRLRSRVAGPHILVQALSRCGIEATTASRCVTARGGGALSMKTMFGSTGFVHLPCVQGQLFSFDGFEGQQAWAVALSNRHANYLAKEHKQPSCPTTLELRYHTRYLAPNEYDHRAKRIQVESNIDSLGPYKLKPADEIVLTRLLGHLHELDLAPAPLAPDDHRLIVRTPPARVHPPAPNALEQELMRVWASVSPQATAQPGQMAPQVAAAALECFRDAGVEARLLHRCLTYRGTLEVFDIQRIALEFQVPGQTPTLVCLSAPGGWEGLVDIEKQTIQHCPGDHLYAGDVSEIDGIEQPAQTTDVHAAISSLFSSHLLALSVDLPPGAPTAPRPRF